MKKRLSILFLVLVLGIMTACGTGEGTGGTTKGATSGGSSLDELKEKGTVTIGFANEAPYAYQDPKTGELKGAAVEIATKVFQNMGIENVEGQIAEWNQLIPGVKAGKFDVITAGMAILPERAEQVAFGEPEIQYGEGLIVEKGNPLDLHSYTDIADNPDVIVAVMSGATEIEFLKEMGVSEDQILEVADIPATFSAVQSGRAQATTGTEMTVKMALESSDQNALEFVDDFEQPDIKGVPSYGAAAFAKGNEELREAYNAELQKLKDNGEILDLITPSGFGEGNLVPNDLTTEQVVESLK
ncbi:ectoine/hydroxyectoine ABC transporter substrate-binding protein EhuB [Fredinandcohnia sp. QZ13]|uniref:ectoine/hydroxyectoine ABC transporter substrate-binding protein EhuB n=1 Tax=Fredinandcohnia sp. QZ13 TaxID=3073144 RepID=UPI0028530252|nr:ectoine/hydroxyectoine ABC transporter substrate-binding protein EhuB [Fredinandcohnia sp. QZ13]MDR4885941.1 ectoine/hydroxyectoine ABC transporter substrate-binding protein EhuB [Fredinandcohnia sp. QZ13]